MEQLGLLTAIIESNPGISMEDAWKMYRELITRSHVLNSQLKIGEPESVSVGQAAEDAKPEKESLTKGYTKRSLKVKPQDAIKKDTIFCCICGKSMASINARHLASHNGLTKEGYLKLCGYPADQALMSLNHLTKMKAQVQKAQKARMKKREGEKAPVKVRKGKKETATA
jgi:predicted transcriptional regulator